MTWRKFEQEIKKLSNKIDFNPDIIIGIVRGGIIPARSLASHLKVKSMFCLTVKKQNNSRIITTEINEDLNNKKILLVEDILETGNSLIVAKKYLEQKGAVVKTACIYVTPQSAIKPTYFIKTIAYPIPMPWE